MAKRTLKPSPTNEHLGLGGDTILYRSLVDPKRKNTMTGISSPRVQRNFTLLLMGAPALLMIIVFAYLPMIGIIIAFKGYKDALGIFDSPWIGFQNFAFLFGTGEIWRITYNTIYMNVLFIVSGLIGAIFIALLLNELRDHSRILIKIYQSALFFPNFVSWVVVSYFVFAFLNADTGTLNHIFQGLGLHPIDWYSEPQYWPWILTIVSLWKGIGIGSVTYLASIVSLNPEYFEAARLDGAGKLRQIWYITLPLLRPIIVIVLLLNIGNILHSDLGLFYQVTRNQAPLYSTTDVIETFVFRSLINLGNLGMTGAASLYQSLFGLVLVMTVNWIIRRINPDYALF